MPKYFLSGSLTFLSCIFVIVNKTQNRVISSKCLKFPQFSFLVNCISRSYAKIRELEVINNPGGYHLMYNP